MVKHGFVLGWVFAWFLIGTWKYFVEEKVNIYWSIAFFLGGLIFGTIVQTILDKISKNNEEKNNDETNNENEYQAF
jgi:putative exporter of polyketide antibiotics